MTSMEPHEQVSDLLHAQLIKWQNHHGVVHAQVGQNIIT
jgi:hypothetical protein